jgi:glycosyltransferase involved in cell wall biosynthesis
LLGYDNSYFASTETSLLMRTFQRPAMIFHVAFRLSHEPRKASELRPVRMLEAFEQLGYEVLEVSGTHRDRQNKIRSLRRRIKNGLKVDFVYSEAATAPTGIGEPVTFSTSFTRDISFLKFCQRKGIPVGLFYRDLYWCFPIYTETVSWPLSALLRGLFRWDLRRYRAAEFRIYLPSLKMAEYLPIIRRERVRALPPGGEFHSALAAHSTDELRLLYVGGLGSNYRLHATIAEIATRDEVSLTLCVPKQQWLEREAEYRTSLGQNISLVHKSGLELEQLYKQVDVCLLAVEPIAYWGFAAPVKLFEYISYGKPIIASNGTFSGGFVVDNDLGWSVDYGSGQLGALIDTLQNDRSELTRVARRVREARLQHTWVARASNVVADLVGENLAVNESSPLESRLD